jgi:hypothetical protein
MQFNEVKDSGKREEFSTGSVRDTREGKGRFDLIPPGPMRRLAMHYANGSRKYGDRNWEKGQPLGRYLDSAERHINELKDCKHDEDHAAAIAWNAFAFMFTVEKILSGELPVELDDIGFTKGLIEDSADLDTQVCSVLSNVTSSLVSTYDGFPAPHSVSGR